MIERPWHRPDCACLDCRPPAVEPTWRQGLTLVSLFALTALVLWWS